MIYDIFLVAGQSNTMSGTATTAFMPIHPKVDQILRDRQDLFDTKNLQVGPAQEPLDHFTLNENKIGFPLLFAHLYADLLLHDVDRRVLLIPCAAGGKGFATEPSWRAGDVLAEDAIQRTLYALDAFPGSRLQAVLWHQGEADTFTQSQAISYKKNLTNLISEFRMRLSHDGSHLPFIMGGMVDGGVKDTAEFGRYVEEALRSMSMSMPQIASVDTAKLTSNHDILGDGDFNHFSAEAQLQMAGLFFDAYLLLKSREILDSRLGTDALMLKSMDRRFFDQVVYSLEAKTNNH